MRVSASRFVPALIEFPDEESRHESWGRFLDLNTAGGRLITRVRLERGDVLFLSFELPGEGFRRVETRVAESSPDPDGYLVCGLRFTRQDDRLRLGRALRRILAAD